MSRCWTTLPAAAVLLGLGATAAAHVAPSADTDNRYLSITPMADRVRFSYTVLVGDAPGRMARHALDLDRDGQVSAAEADAWAKDLAARVLAGLEVTIDGHPVPVTWDRIDVGMDDHGVDAGAFSLDLIAWLCLPDASPRRVVDLVDRFALTPAGETEVRIADEPGVHVEVSRIGRNDMVGRISRFQAIAAPLAEGLHLVYTVTDARPLADGRCPAPPKPRRAISRWPVLVGALGALALVVALGLRRRFARS